MPRFALTVSYDGTEFHGWQRQEPPGKEPLRTVQGVMERVVSRVIGAPVIVMGSSRTDAGVHARGQVAAFTADTPIPVHKLPLALNARLPDDIQVTAAREVAHDFDPISDALSKGYRYVIDHPGLRHADENCAAPASDIRREFDASDDLSDPPAPPTTGDASLASPPAHSGRTPHGPLWLPSLFERRYVYATWYRLDHARMAAAARHFVGTHDFTSVAHMVHLKESPVRTVHDCTVTAESDHRLRLDISGSGFLYNMVRIIAGTLIDVGRGRIAPDAIPQILAARERKAAGDTAPAHGLCLMWVRYPSRT